MSCYTGTVVHPCGPFLSRESGRRALHRQCIDTVQHFTVQSEHKSIITVGEGVAFWTQQRQYSRCFNSFFNPRAGKRESGRVSEEYRTYRAGLRHVTSLLLIE